MTAAATPELLLEAGAIVPPKGDKWNIAEAGVALEASTAATADRVSARRYAHPALGEDPVVRLTADNVAPGEDLTLEFYGFGAPEVTPGVGLRRRRSLGFPAWALIHDPDHAHFALQVVKQLKREARRARTKPGHAWDAIVRIGDAMDRSVVHFLPSFFEEVGRVFIELGNSTYAGRAFAKARDAEQVHALEVDQEHLREVFLEFALAGALTVKVLSTYSKDLEKSRRPADAWELFRDLCVRRTLGGLPPWKAMPADLRRLIKAAGLDADAQEIAFLREVIASQAMKRAHHGLWQTYGKVIRRLADDDPEVAGMLLNLLPVPSGMWGSEFFSRWLEHLDEWGLLADLWRDDVPAAAGPRGGVAAWIERFLAPRTEVPDRLLEVLRQAAGRIVQDGRPLQLAVRTWGYRHEVDVDLLDLALELGVPLADPPEHTECDLKAWAGARGPGRRPDPVHMAADPRFEPVLRAAVPDAAGDADFERAATGQKALGELRRQWLLGLVDDLDRGGLPRLARRLEALSAQTSRAIFEEFPEAFPPLRDADPAAVLARTLRGGLFDELGWEALDQAVAELDPGSDDEEFQWSGNAPYLVVSDGVRALALGPGGRLLEHELRLPKDARLAGLAYLDGEQLVRYDDDSTSGLRYYWSGDPDKRRDDSWRYQTMAVTGAVATVAGGGWFRGDGVVHAGGKYPEDARDFCCDGEHFWLVEWEGAELYLREIDPASGKTGRRSLPSFFEDGLAAGFELELAGSHLLHLGAGLEGSPLGSRDGLVGWRLLESAAGAVEGEGIDGRRFSGSLGTGQVGRYGERQLPVAVLELPGTRCPVSGSVRSSRELGLWQADGRCDLATLEAGGPYNAGQPAVLPPLYWHLFRPRDPAGSEALRATSPEIAKRLLDSAVAEAPTAPSPSPRARMLARITGGAGTAGTGEKKLPATRRLAAELFPEIAHPGLLHGLIGVLGHAAELAGRHRRLCAERDPEAAEASAAPLSDERWLRKAARRLGIYGDDDESRSSHLLAAGAFLTGETSAEDSRPLPELSAIWLWILDGLEARAWTGLWIRDEPGDYLKFLEWWSQIPLVGLGTSTSPLRLATGEFDDKPPFPVGDGYRNWFVGERDGSRYLGAHDFEGWTVLEVGAGGRLLPLPGFSYRREVEAAPWDGGKIERLAALTRERGLPYPSEARLSRLSACGLSRAEAALVWTGCPNFRESERKFLPDGLRRRLGLKVVEADNARKSLEMIDESIRRALVTALLDGDPAELWEAGSIGPPSGGRASGPVDRLVEAYRQSVPPRLRLPDKLVKELDGILGYRVDKPAATAALAAPGEHPMFARDGRWRLASIDQHLELVETGAPEGDGGEHGAFGDTAFRVAVECLPLFAYRLPAGDPAQLAMIDVARCVSARLKHPDLLLDLGERWQEEECLEKLLGAAEPTDQGFHQCDQGLVAGAETGWSLKLAFRPARIRDDADRRRLRDLAAAGEVDAGGLRRLELWHSPGYQALVERLGSTPVAAGQWEVNPLQSAPEQVAKVGAARSLGEDAAVLYLQLLALPDPTTANVKAWNGWTPARYKKAVAELAAAGLVLEAKRARAGRKHFLPGGWEALKSPHLPLETWKLPLYRLARDAGGKVRPTLGAIVPLEPVHQLFERAWKRVESDDAPCYEEIS